jgi:hypothetical protein
MDDFLGFDDSKGTTKTALISLLHQLGWHLSTEKSDLNLSFQKEYLGLILNTEKTQTFQVPLKRRMP